MSKRIAELLDEHPGARAVLLEKHGLVTWGETPRRELCRHDRVRLARGRCARAQQGRPLRPRRSGGTPSSADGEANALLAASLPALRGALLADTDGVILEVDRSPEAVAFASLGARGRGQPDRSAVPGSPDQHQAPAARRRRSIPSATAPTSSAARSVPASSTSRTGTAPTTTRNVDDETRPFPIDPAGPRVVARARRRHRRDRRRRRQGALRARPLPPRDRGRGRGRRGRRLPLAERGRGVRDRVLAARALQAGAGAAAAASSPAGSRSSPAARAASAARRPGCSRRAEPTSSVADLNAEGAQQVAEELVAAHGARRAIAVESTSPTRRRSVATIDATVLAYGGLDILVASAGLATSAPITETTARGLGAQLRRARARLLPRRTRGVPRAARAGPRRLDRLRRLEERARRGRERGRVLVGEGGVAAPGALPRRGGRRRTGSASTPSTPTP